MTLSVSDVIISCQVQDEHFKSLSANSLIRASLLSLTMKETGICCCKTSPIFIMISLIEKEDVVMLTKSATGKHEAPHEGDKRPVCGKLFYKLSFTESMKDGNPKMWSMINISMTILSA